MAVIYKCIYCNKKIKSDCVYEGPITGFPKFMENKIKELSDKCDCRMERLTKRTSKGVAYMAIADTVSKSEQEIISSKPILEGVYDMFQKLACFEDREEPKQAIKIDGVSSQACPICKKDVNWKYCSNCGQRIKY